MKYLRKNRNMPRKDLSTPPRVYRKQMPDTPPVTYTGAEDETSHEQHLKYLAAECRKVKPNPTVTQQLMRRTFALRQKEIKEDHLPMLEILSKYPPLKSYKEVSPEMDSDLMFAAPQYREQGELGILTHVSIGVHSSRRLGRGGGGRSIHKVSPSYSYSQ